MSIPGTTWRRPLNSATCWRVNLEVCGGALKVNFMERYPWKIRSSKVVWEHWHFFWCYVVFCIVVVVVVVGAVVAIIIVVFFITIIVVIIIIVVVITFIVAVFVIIIAVVIMIIIIIIVIVIIMPVLFLSAMWGRFVFVLTCILRITRCAFLLTFCFLTRVDGWYY